MVPTQISKDAASGRVVGRERELGWLRTCLDVARQGHLWRHAGFAMGTLLAAVVADLLGLAAAIVAVRMCETHLAGAAAPAALATPGSGMPAAPPAGGR